MHSLATRLLCFVPCVVLTLGPMVSAQNTSGGAKPSRRPLSDYVACAFYGGGDFFLRGPDKPTPPPPPKKNPPHAPPQVWEGVFASFNNNANLATTPQVLPPVLF